jgi:hypothetical protein
MSLTRPSVTRSFDAKVRALYDELSGTTGPSMSAMLRAYKAGHPPPAAWDDDTIGLPEARTAGYRRYDGPGLVVERVEAAVAMRSGGARLRDIAEHFDVSVSTARRWVMRAVA